MSLLERALFMSYMAGAGQISAEAGGAIAFLTTLDAEGAIASVPTAKFAGGCGSSRWRIRMWASP